MGKTNRTSGHYRVKFEGAPDIVKRLKKLESGGEKAITRTVSDFASRAPAWVAKGIREHYGVDAAAIKDTAQRPKRGDTTIKVKGIEVDGATLVYKGRRLTPIHFNMKPAAINPKGMTLNRSGHAIPKKYEVKATIIKEKGRATFRPGTFLAPAKRKTKEGDPDAKIIPWQRQGDGRYPVRPIHTLSVPQMIDGRAKDTINELINENLQKRLDNHIKQVMK